MDGILAQAQHFNDVIEDISIEPPVDCAEADIQGMQDMGHQIAESITEYVMKMKKE